MHLITNQPSILASQTPLILFSLFVVSRWCASLQYLCLSSRSHKDTTPGILWQEKARSRIENRDVETSFLLYKFIALLNKSSFYSPSVMLVNGCFERKGLWRIRPSKKKRNIYLLKANFGAFLFILCLVLYLHHNRVSRFYKERTHEKGRVILTEQET